MRVVESESEDSLEDVNEIWCDVTENLEIPERTNFCVWPEVPSNIVKPLHYFILFFTDQLLKKQITKNIYNSKIKAITNNSI